MMGQQVIKKMAGYHQFHAVNMAVEETLRATATSRGDLPHEAKGGYYVRPMHGGHVGDKRVGVVWHTRFGQVAHDGVLRRTARP